jgi:hypothetical protein
VQTSLEAKEIMKKTLLPRRGYSSGGSRSPKQCISCTDRRNMNSGSAFSDVITGLIPASGMQLRLALWAILVWAVTLGSTASALTINLTYDPDSTFTAAGLTASDIVAMKAANTYVKSQFSSNYNDNINVNIKVTAVPGTGTLGHSDTFLFSVASYTALRNAVAADSRTGDDVTALGGGGSLPSGADPIGSAHAYLVSTAEAKALGLTADNFSNDGTFTFGGGFSYTYDPLNRAVPGKIDFIGVAMHEFSEIMGRIGLMGQNITGSPNYMLLDLFNYTGVGARGLNDGPGRFLSINNGATLLKAFNDHSSNGGDLADWASGTNDAFNAFSSSGVQNDLTLVDLRKMDVIGYDRTGTSSPTPTATATATATPVHTATPTATATATATPVHTATPIPTPCGGGTDVIADGGFENGGVPSTIWNNPQSSTNFGTPLCDEATCGTAGGVSPPRTGLFWAWFGGIAAPETATLGQNVTIPSGGSATLNFWMRIGTVSSPFTDVLNVRVDGAVVQSYPEPSVAENAYTLRAINLNAFANGAMHNIEFEYIGPSANTGSYVVDDVSLVAGSTCGTPAPTPTAPPCGGTVFSQTFDGVTAPALPAGWAATNPTSGNGTLWATSAGTSHTAPNCAFIADQDGVSDKVLDTPGITITSASAQLSFRNNFNTEFDGVTYWDGGVLEVSSPNINGGVFTDVTSPAVGGSFVTGGYTGPIETAAGNPLAGRMAWSGDSGGYINTVVNLGPNVSGWTIRLRFRMGTDEAVGAPGWRVDTVSITDGPCGATFGNISTRLRVGTGDNAMIGGFIITGSQAKTVIVRGMGPSLPVAGALADPVIEVHGASGALIATNDNWLDDPNRQQVIDGGLAPSNSLESALWGILNPDTYTVIVRGRNNATGVGLFEVYDMDQRAGSKLANISTRGFVDTGDNVMIGGTILVGTVPATVLFRAIGPSLANFGIPNVLADPVLELHGPNGFVTIINNNWRDTQQAEIIATGIPPSNDLESAIIQTLSPGQYTAIVRGANNTTGVALVEAYQLQ